MDDLHHIVPLFSERIRGFDSVETANEATRRQAEFYSSFYSSLVSVTDPRMPPTATYIKTVTGWITAILQHDPPRTTHIGDRPGVTSPLPVLTQDAVEAISNLLDGLAQEDRSRIATIIASAPIVEAAPAALRIQKDLADPVERQLWATATAMYAAAKMRLISPTVDTSAIAQDMQIFKATMLVSMNDTQLEVSQIKAELQQAAITSAQLRNTIAETEQRVEKSKETLTNFETTIRAELSLDRSRENWNKRYEEARVSFRNTAILLSIMIALPAILALFFGGKVVNFINQPGIWAILSGSVSAAFAQHIARLVVVTVPIFVYLWAVRVVVRYLMRSMMLKDDARMRETMLDTYFMLTESGRAADSDKPIILNALFRPAAGHGTEGTDPPDMAAYLNAIKQQ